MFKEAQKEDLIPLDLFPFNKFTVKKDKSSGKMTKIIRKTNRQHSVRIGQKAVEILEKYRQKDQKQEDIIFPFANIDKNYFTDKEHRNLITGRAIALSNMYLRKMGTRLELPFNLSFHGPFRYRYYSSLCKNNK